MKVRVKTTEWNPSRWNNVAIGDGWREKEWEGLFIYEKPTRKVASFGYPAIRVESPAPLTLAQLNEFEKTNRYSIFNKEIQI